MTTQIEAMKMALSAHTSLLAADESENDHDYYRALQLIRESSAMLHTAIEVAEKVEPVAVVKDGVLVQSNLPKGFTGNIYIYPSSAEIDEMRKDATKLRSVLNEFDNPYQIGDVWQWIGPTPETVDAALEKQP